MIFDHRTYTCRPWTLPAQMEMYAKHGFAPMTRHQGYPALYATTDSGAFNSYVHIWTYQNLDHRMTQRKALQTDPEFVDYMNNHQKVAKNVVRQENHLFVPVQFFRPEPFADRKVPLLFEHCIDVARPGCVPRHLALFERMALPVLSRHYGQPYLLACSESGELNLFLQVWAFDGADARSRRRRALLSDPAYHEYVEAIADASHLTSQRSAILLQAPFFNPVRRSV